MATKNLFWVEEMPHGTSKIEQERLTAKLKSHAAIVGHRKKMGRIVPVVANDHNDDDKRDFESIVEGFKDNDMTSLRSYGQALHNRNEANQPTSSIPCNPRINEAVEVYKHYYSLVCRGVVSSTPGHVWPYGSNNEWHDTIKALQYECVSRAFALAYVAVMKRTTGQSYATQRGELVLKSESSTALRKKIQQSQGADPAILNGVLYRFTSALFSGDGAEAKIHGTMLRKVLLAKEQQEGRSAINPVFLARCLWHDSHNSLAHMTPTIFDFNWASDVLSPYLQPIDKTLTPYEDSFLSGMDKSVQAEPLRTIFLTCRQSIILRSKMQSAKNAATTSVLNLWIVQQSSITRGKLVNYYIKSRHMLKSSEIAEDAGYVAFWLTQAALTLATLVVMIPYGKSLSGPMMSNRPILLAMESLMGHLKYTVDQILALSTSSTASPELWQGYRKAHLWVAFVAAHNEQMQALDGVLPGPASEEPFNRAFLLLTRFLKLTHWPDIRKVLSAFIYDDEVEPNGRTWVEETVQTPGNE